jgi:hypothetical protein
VINFERHYGQLVFHDVYVLIPMYAKLEASLWALRTEIQDRPQKVRSLWKCAWPFCKGATSVNLTS